MRRKKKMTPETIGLIANRFKVMSDAMRLQILHELQAGERSVTQIVEMLAASQPNVSKHLKILQEAGLVTRRQEGNTVFYSIADASIFEMCEVVCNSLVKQANEKIASLSFG
jgi:DNA-binding transcriptional ArsR family regulator